MNDKPPDDSDELLDHYEFDYRKAKPNRFAALFKPSSTLTNATIMSPWLAHPEQEAHFTKEVVEVPDELNGD